MSAKPGERKDRILQVLAQMLEEPRAVKITTAALAAKLEVSEAALYRHFASKAQMFEGLIEFIEATLFSLINKLTDEEKSAIRQIEGIMALLLGFARKNPGMTRVLIGDALINENERLQIRINQLHDRLEATLKQALRFGVRRGRNYSGCGRGRRGEPADVLCDRTLAPVCQKRLQTRPDGALGSAAQSAVLKYCGPEMISPMWLF